VSQAVEWRPKKEEINTKVETFLPSQQDVSNYSAMESGVRALDIITLLQERVAFLSGGRDGRGGPIISFPSTPKRERIKPEDLRRIISYLLNIPRFVAITLVL
jgi:hypothetical protein